MEKWPNFFVVGAAKAGTTSLYEYLKIFPEIFMSPVKEPNFFCIKTIPLNYPYMHKVIRNKNEYLSLFNAAKNYQIRGEASPSYLPDPYTPKLIKENVPNAKIIISLRDPVERAYSHYWMFYSRKIINMSFREQYEIELFQKGKLNPPDLGESGFVLKNSLYFDNVKRYVDYFGKENIKIIFFEKMVKDTSKTIKELLEFLNVEPANLTFEKEIHNKLFLHKPRNSIFDKILNNAKIREISKIFLSKNSRNFIKESILNKKITKPKMVDHDKRILIKYFQKDVKSLSNLLNTQLPWPNFSS